MLYYNLLVIILLLWAGMILGISCLEAWVKFKTPSLTKPVGLDVGRTVFRAFHNVQWGLLALLVFGLLFARIGNFYFIIPFSIGTLLSLQTFWIFPHLNANVELILAGRMPNKNSYHTLYAVIEMFKLLLLLGSGMCFMAT